VNSARLAKLAVRSARRVDWPERLEDRELECFGDACLVKPLEARLGRGVQQGEEDGQQPFLREIVVEAAVPTAALDEAADACADRLVAVAQDVGSELRARGVQQSSVPGDVRRLYPFDGDGRDARDAADICARRRDTR
jgi:hypothetical protein